MEIGCVSDQYPDRLRLPLAFDPARLEADLAQLDQGAWIKHFVNRNYEGDWSVLPLRAAAGATHPVMTIYSDPGATAFEDTPHLARTPYFRAVLAAFRCPLQAVRLMRLAAGSVIKEHNDGDHDAEHGSARLHVPITTGPEVEFLLARKPVRMAPGSVWYLRVSENHSVANRGRDARVHLVIDALVNDWLLDAFARALSDAARAPGAPA